MVKTFGNQILKKDTLIKDLQWTMNIVSNVIFFVLSFFISGRGVYEKFFPFGVSLVASVPYANLFLSALGSSLGYLISSDVNYSVKYAAIIVAICATRWLLKDFKVLRSKLCCSVVCSLILFFMSFPLYIHDNFSLYDLLNISLESILAGIYSYFFGESINIFLNYFKSDVKDIALITNARDLIIISVSFFVVTFSLSSINLGPISLGRALSIYMLLVFCRSGGILIAGLATIILEFIFSFKIITESYYIDSYNFLLSSICMIIVSAFSKQSKLKMSAMYIFFSMLLKLCLLSNLNTSVIVSSLYESIFACTFFLATPEYIFRKISKIDFSADPTISSSSNIQKYLSLKLKFLADSFINIGSGLDVISLRKDEHETKHFQDVMKKVTEKFCSVCPLSVFCLGDNKDKTINYLKNIYKGESTQMYAVKFGKICPNFKEIENYSEYLKEEKSMKDITQMKIDEMKDYIVDQFKSVGSVLGDISSKFDKLYKNNQDVSYKIFDILRKNKIDCLNVFCNEFKNKKWCIEISVMAKSKQRFENLNLEEILKSVYAKEFNSPSLLYNYRGNPKYVVLEKTTYIANIGISQHVSKNGNFCGDSYKYFYTEDGQLVLILCDGMGTGIRAAIEGTLACEILSTLIKAGVNFEIALKIANTTLLTNPNEESLAALDLVFFDLNTGNTKFIKAGAASSIVKKNGEIKILTEVSLPIGILKEVDYAMTDVKLNAKDKFLVMSDGAAYSGIDWIVEEVKKWEEINCNDSTERIVKNSLEKRKDEQDDDITVIAVEVLKN